MSGLATVAVTRYVTPLREGGSLPGIVEGDDLGTYVCKFRGAGQGLRVLVAEVIVAELARLAGLHTPRQVVLDLNPEIARYEADEEVQELLTVSAGTNLGIDFLPGSYGVDSLDGVAPDVAARVVWLDAFCANVDRSWRNPNLLVWGGDLWVIDHGASLYFHHGWTSGVTDPARFAAQTWDASDHIFASHPSRLGDLHAVDLQMREAITPAAIAAAVALVPPQWFTTVPGAETPDAVAEAYVQFLVARLGTRQWLPGLPGGAA